MEQFEFLLVPVVTVDLAPATVVETTIDKTGPPGPAGEDGTTADTQMILDHIADGSNPHGITVTQDILIVRSPRVQTAALVNTGTAVTANFSDKSAVAYTVNGNAAITASNISAGQRVSLSLYCDATLRTVTWVGVNRWIGGTPVLTASKLTVVTLFHDGINVIGAWGTQL
jgi:hypothetical protein